MNIEGVQEAHDLHFLNFFFAFKSDLSTINKVDDLQKYINTLENINSRNGVNKYIHGFCIVGVGFVFRDGAKWLAIKANSNFNEVIGFLRITSDLSILSFIKKRNPFLGTYLIENEHFEII